jgi:protein TonB
MTPYPPFSSNPCLWAAVAVSLVLHAAVLFSGARLFASLPASPRVADAMRVKLVEPVVVPAPQPAASQPTLLKREDTPRKAVTAPLQKAPRLVRRPASGGPDNTTAPTASRELRGDAARKAGEQIARRLFYPAEAIARGLEGETLVLLFLDESGNAVAARIEASSGHVLLDEAAVRAARTLRSLPASAPREAVVPVRFRLR